MSEARIFAPWPPQAATIWGKLPLKLGHGLAEHPLFAEAALAALIERYPREHYQLMEPARTSGGRSREGDLGGASGHDVLAAIAKGRMWLNLRNLAAVDGRYAALMRRIFAEMEEQLPGLRTLSQTVGLFISSPGSRTHYHADLPGQSLWQIRGRKRIYIYEPVEPFLSARQLEEITLSRREFIAYERWYDDHARVFELAPGDVMHWPLNAPHRIDNHDCLNVSMTMEYFTPEIRRRHVVNRANAILRLMRLEPRSTATSGAGFYAKLALQRALRDRAFVRRRDAMTAIEATWRPDPSRPGAVADLTP